MDQSILYQKQISLTEWFADIDHHLTEEMRKEDNEKRDRLKILKEVIGLPYDEPHQFLALLNNEKVSEYHKRAEKFVLG